jgi:hypothetical protein
MFFRAAARFALGSLLVGGLLFASVATRADEAPADDDPATLAEQSKSADQRPSTARPPVAPLPPRPRVNQPPVTQPTPAPPIRPNPNDVALANPEANSFINPAAQRYYSLATTPNMFGDVLGMRYFFGGAGNLSLAAGDRAAKIADDSRPLPTDRLFFDYNHFDQANITANGAVVGLDRYTLGIEKAFCDGLWSVEIKAPIESGLNRIQDLDASTNGNEGTMFGNLSIAPKVLVYESCRSVIAAGVLFDLPTAPDAQFLPSGVTTTMVKDDAVHIEPFIGLQFAPNCRLFSITYLQFDFDANGDRVFDLSRTGLQPFQVGRLRGPNSLYVDWSAGYWLFHDGPCDCCGRRYLTGVAPVIELHYATAVENARSVGTVEAARDRVDILNLTSGAHFELGRCSTLAVAVAVPLRTQPRDKEFSTELLVEFNRRF